MTVGDAAARAATGGLVGRRDEVAALRAAVHDALAGRPAFVIVEGEAGIGKTRLVRHVAEQAGQAGFDVHLGRCHEHLTLPYLALTSLLDRLAAVAAGSPALHTFAPVIDRLLGRDSAADPWAGRSSDEQRALLFHATSQALLTLATERAVLIALDDLHWVDPPTLDLLAHLVDALDTASLREGTRILIIATCRSDEGGAVGIALERLARSGVGRRLDVGGLDRGEVAELLLAHGVTSPSRRSIETVVQLTRGNPLAVEGVARQVRLGELVDLEHASQLTLPVELEEHAARRVADLSPTTRAILSAAALLDRSTTVEELATIGDFAPDEVAGAREEGIANGVLAPGGGGLRFAHALFSRALVQALPASARASQHADIAARLATDATIGVAEVAHHLLAGRAHTDDETVLRVCAAAGEQAWAQVAWADACRYFTAAAGAADTLARADGERGQLWLRAARAALRDHDFAPARSAYDVALPLLERADDRDGAATALAERALAETLAGSLSVDVRPVADAVSRLNPAGAGNAGRTLSQLADLLWMQGRIDESRQAAAQALEIGKSAGDQIAVARAHLARGMSHLVLLELDAAGRAMGQAQTAAAAGDDRWWSTAVAARLALVRLLAGRLGDADRIAADAATAARAVGQLANEAMAEGVRAAVAAARGDRGVAEQRAAEAERAGRLADYAWSTGLAFPALVWARLLVGDHSAVDETIDDWLARTGRALSPYRDLATLTRLVALAHRGDTDGLARGAAEHERLLRRRWPVGLSICQWGPAVVEIAAVGDVDLPVEAAAHQLEELHEAGVMFTDGLPLFVPRLRGVARGLAGDHDGAIEHLKAAVDIARSAGARAEVGRTNLDLADALAADQPADARRAATEALHAFEATSALGWAARARDLLARLGGVEPASPYEVGQTPERQRAVILFTDIVESTSLTEALGDAEFRGRTATLERCVRRAVAGQGGHTMSGVRLGDGLVALFPLAPAAAACAAAAHECAAEVGLRLRIGLHAGDVLTTDDTAHGAAANLTARICAEAEPGETLVSDQVRALIHDWAWNFEDRGVRPLKGVGDAPRLFCITADN